MTDPFSIIGLLGTAVSLTTIVLQYASGVKDAPEEVEKLKRGCTSLQEVFEQLIELMNDEDFRQEFADVSALYNAVGDIVVTLETLERTLKRHSAAKGVSKTVTRIKWPFERTRTQELVQSLQRYIQIFQFALTIRGSKILAQTSQKASEIMNTSKTLSRTQSEILEAISALPEHDEIVAELHKLSIDMGSLKSQRQKSSEQNFFYTISTLDFHSKQKDAYSKRHASTGQWLLETEQFQTWFDGNGSPVLWCPGNPGTGKTILTSIAVNYVAESTRGQRTVVVFVYCDYKDSSTHSVSALLSSILRQLIEQTPRAESVTELSRFLDENAGHRDPTEEELLSRISAVSKDFNDVYTFVDALDECPELNRDVLLSRLQQLVESGQIRLFLTSRLNVDIMSKFQDASRIEISATTFDIEAYLKSEIQKSSRLALHMRKDPNLKQEIIARVVEKAHGMFLLAGLQIDSLCMQTSSKGVRKVLDVLPTGIFATYDDAFKRMLDQPQGDAELGMNAMSLVFCATRPLGIDELRHALAVQPSDRTLDQGGLTEIEIVLSITTGLLSTFKVDDPESTAFPTAIRFVHYTLQEYVEANHERLFPTAQRDMASICLTYLSFVDFEDASCAPELADDRFQDFKFFTYAGYNWYHHLHGVQMELMEQTLPFIRNNAKTYGLLRRFPPDVRAWGPFIFRDKSWAPAHFAIIWNLTDVVGALNTDQNLDITSVDFSTAFHLTLFAGRTAPLDKALMVAMKEISSEINFVSTRNVGTTSVDRARSVNIQDKDGQTVLHAAIRWSMFYTMTSRTNAIVAVIGVILDRGAALDVQDSRGYTPLHCAAFSGNPEIVSMLVKRGASLNIKDCFGRAPLHCAASALYEENIKVLLRESEVNAQDSKGRTPLHHAYIRWSMIKHLSFGDYIPRRNALPLLLAAGASETIVDADGRIPSDYTVWKDKAAGKLMQQDYEWLGL